MFVQHKMKGLIIFIVTNIGAVLGVVAASAVRRGRKPEQNRSAPTRPPGLMREPHQRRSHEWGDVVPMVCIHLFSRSTSSLIVREPKYFTPQKFRFTEKDPKNQNKGKTWTCTLCLLLRSALLLRHAL